MVKTLDPRVSIASGYRSQRRVLRNPKHPFQLRVRPYQIQPFMLSPVLPGETLKNLVMQSRVVTKPVKHKLLGWWCEYYFFYVRLKDIEYHLKAAEGEWLAEMVTQPDTYDPAPLREPADAKYYHAAGATPWLKYCTQAIVEYFFRDEGEAWNVATLDGLPLAQISGRSWLDSLTLNDDKRTDRDMDLDLNNDGNLTAQELMQGMAEYNALRDAGLVQMDYEDWISTFGVNIPEKNEDSPKMYRPELIRYSRQWAYPANTVEPTTGVPSSALSWINAFRADKDRLFKEPGFVVGLQVVKPKVYLEDPTGSLAGFMETLEDWLPALSQTEYEKGFKSFGATAGPLASRIGTTPFKAYWVDMRDLFKYGDQFMNFVPDSASGALNVITATGGARYPSTADLDSLFAGAAPANIIETDGVVDLSIAGRVVDHTRGRKTI